MYVIYLQKEYIYICGLFIFIILLYYTYRKETGDKCSIPEETTLGVS